ncbi:unnamed protein product [Kuraishia capsulata CBS 1993]|uniref:Replication termination factor 2 n=1 Tax=Kuraishia capsulata CBS 1993 TaxID=1382522 RepID=W6MTG2_9ASCO|nr:uncharacterized protein KUCA_T00005999001 [Kuraishia capsulata CBS 1993]CDK30004.1 unnamed protein product [Kuraishia capsulata CBS 1993]
MGNDGGTLPSRSEILGKPRKREKKPTNYWRFDRLTKKRLMPPIVADSRGNMFNKETVLEMLLNGERMTHLRGIKDVTQLNFQINPKTGNLQCPITLKDQNVENPDPFVFLPCGDVMSKKIVDELLLSKGKGDTELKCPVCDKPTRDTGVIQINSDTGKLKVKKRKTTESK